METDNKPKSFHQYINESKPVLVDFYADWCGPCKVIVLKINVDKNAKVSAKYQIQSIPTLILFKNGQIKWRQSGVVPVKQLEQIISTYK